MGAITIIGSNGVLADVSAGNRLLSRPYSDWLYAVDNGLAFSWTNATYDYDANDTILGVENNSATHDLYIWWIGCTGSTATQIVVHTSSGVTMAGTAVTGVNMNRNSNVAAASYTTAKADETGNGQQAASYTGRLLAGRIANAGWIEWDVQGAIRLPNDNNIGIDYTADGTTCQCTILGYMKAR